MVERSWELLGWVCSGEECDEVGDGHGDPLVEWVAVAVALVDDDADEGVVVLRTIQA
ncbi:hypothetical protein Rrhod_0591 [Rhodococcus rhodnii LMG 5362]|uniref:Uncharacterized protein n=1 Tax=Rhodococcus rhodnii LMG 5362 TaxID=1273125 RepID=R7WRY8_9NOCA|nr:hypothetical protein Rrhod_0591 [Rhodococcus rhodnii LMG 5362]